MIFIIKGFWTIIFIFIDKDEDNSRKTLNDKNHQASKTIVRKPLMIKIIKLHLRNLDN